MKKTTKKLLLAALLLGLPSLQGTVYADIIEVITVDGGAGDGLESGMYPENEIIHDNKEEEFPRRIPTHYSHLVNANWDKSVGSLSVNFFTSTTQAVISIYKGEVLIEETTCQISMGDIIEFDLSMYGSGDYQLVITGVGRSTLYGNFSK